MNRALRIAYFASPEDGSRSAMNISHDARNTVIASSRLCAVPHVAKCWRGNTVSISQDQNSRICDPLCKPIDPASMPVVNDTVRVRRMRQSNDLAER